MTDNPFRVGVLGAGQIAQAAHFPACRKAKDAELYAICDAADDLRERDGRRPPAAPRRTPTTTRCSPMRRSTP